MHGSEGEGDGNAALLPGGAVETHGPGTMG